jgi:hypothetical protein
MAALGNQEGKAKANRSAPGDQDINMRRRASPP